jgi:hypothetical protein
VSGLVELARYATRVEADLARLLLESEGIEAVLFDAETHSVGWGPMMPVRLMVLERDRWLAS